MKKIVYSVVSVILLCLSGCGGSGGDGPTAAPPVSPPPVNGIGRTGYTHGPVATFGSIVVNGVRYETNSANFTINDSPGSQADLRVGDVVTVLGSIDANGTTGVANEVVFEDIVKGPVTSIDVPGNSLLVLGQIVLVRPETIFDDSFSPASIEGVSVAQIVEVSGQFDANGDIVATRIEPKPAGTQFEVHGTVENLDAGNMVFSLAGLQVDFSSATLDNFVGGQISNGDVVEAKGLTLGGSGELIATQVELESLLPDAADGDRVEIEGFITRFASGADFDVAGLPVSTTGATIFVGGGVADLDLNIKVEVEGDIDANGVLIATSVDIRRAKAVRVTADIDSVNAGAGTLVVLGINVSVDALTRIEDKSDADVDPLAVSDLNAGDYVEVRGDEFPAGSGNMLATILEREDPDTEAILQGFVESVANPSFQVLGVTIETNGSTVFRDENDGVISSADFFNQVGVNSLVKAEGTETTATSILATEVEFELEF